MTVLFKNIRVYGFLAVILTSAGVLGISAYFASIFLPNLHHDYTIYSLVPPSYTILVFTFLLVGSTPRTDAIYLFISVILWLTLASWSSDVIGATQCDALGNTRTSTKNGTISARSYCDLSKVIEAFSWATFCLVTLYFIFVIALASRSMAMGRSYIWGENVHELPWFGQAPGYPGTGYTSYPSQYGPRTYNSPYTQYPTTTYAGNVVQQQPGHSLVIQPGRNGAPTTVRHVPSAI
ncbi:hypothetical protein BC827DRAFT_784896 [Russula dissimulans]|nr:hypothetical protein BC827DRAFT_784896 [Russula dissimulans]